MKQLTFSIIALTMIFIGCARADVPTPPKAQAGAAELDPTLDLMQKAGTNLKNFIADVELKEFDDLSGESTNHIGKVVFDNRGEAKERMHVDLPIVIIAKKQYNDKRIEYKLEDGWLWDRDYKNKTEVKRQVLAPGQKMNLLKLGEGPFPLPIGQDKETVKKEFDAKIVAPAKDDPADSIHVELITRPNGQFAKRFKKIDVFVDAKSGFPKRVDTEGPSGQQKSTVLTNLKVNDAGVGDRDFVLEEIKNWNQRIEDMKQ